jgi:2-oxoglutarate dehydrogenase E2 component (dihydrolipoamide succinyltransferase)
VNAPEAGTIKEFLVNEEDTVTVGQDLLRIELGGEPRTPSGDKPAEAEQKEPPKEAPKEPAPEKQAAPEPKPQESKPAPPPAPAKEAPSAPKQESKPAKASTDTIPTGPSMGIGSREERRVSLECPSFGPRVPC